VIDLIQRRKQYAMRKGLEPLLKLALTVALFIVVGASFSYAERLITPYGDYCPRFRHYGMKKSMHSYRQTEQALRQYYNRKGFDVEIITSKGRFIKANVKKEDKIVDTIVFDRHTGRIRSIY
jgi:hypothetical protein